jgi:hypothetical protein
MPPKDLSGKKAYDLDREDFEKLFCRQCHEYGECPRDDKKMLGCKAFVDSGQWDKFYRKRDDVQLIRCRYCGTKFPKRGEGLQKCPGCGSELLC